MKRIKIFGVVFMIVLAALFVAAPVSGQSTDIESYKSGLQDFADGVANSLPFNSTIGLNWSDAYIGQLIDMPPHFGVGLSLGATTVPMEAVQTVLDITDTTLPSELDYIADYGMPLPAYTLDGRIGGFGFPFDIGVKVGFIPEELGKQLPFEVNYLNAGADFRWALVEEDMLLPDVSVGGGFNYIDQGAYIPEVYGSDVTMNIPYLPNDNNGGTLTVTAPDLFMGWQSSTIDLKAQVSKTLLFIRPFLGAGASYGWSSVTAGLASEVTYNDGTTDDNSYLQEIGDYYGVDINGQEVVVGKDVSGWGFRAFGGVGFDILLLKLDLTAMYNFTSGSIGAALNTRIQI